MGYKYRPPVLLSVANKSPITEITCIRAFTKLFGLSSMQMDKLKHMRMKQLEEEFATELNGMSTPDINTSLCTKSGMLMAVLVLLP
jgi:hypothetical protein